MRSDGFPTVINFELTLGDVIVDDITATIATIATATITTGDITDLTAGIITLPEDGGMVDVMDIAVTANPAAGVEEGYNFCIDSTVVLEVLAEADSSGSIQNPAVRITGDMVIAGSVNTAVVANTFRIGMGDLSAGNTQLELYGEGTCIGTGTPTPDGTVAMMVNGVQKYFITADAAS